jgi:hypothetical protein
MEFLTNWNEMQNVWTSGAYRNVYSSQTHSLEQWSVSYWVTPNQGHNC